MLSKGIYGGLGLWLVMMGYGCHAVHNQAMDNAGVNSSNDIPVPVCDVDLPSSKFSLYFPTIALKEPEIPLLPVFDITENFCPRDINQISVSDPKLFADGNTMVIDLSRFPGSNYCFPLPGAKVISPYAGRRIRHSGTDLKTFANDTIRAAFDGIVRMAKAYASYGNVIVIRHFNGMETVYSHNSKHLVKQGEYVKAGTPVALLGRTGRATTEHLHFEVRINGQHFNPELLFDMETHTLQAKCLVCTKKNNRIEIASVDPFPYQSYINPNASN
ncbi:MAG: M23 family metallopeptidase [Tannerellaceae bacterium]|jgi:hypothetical protein|nr:M23 family metallopeptidase [Tannerellaceae bacterium]